MARDPRAYWFFYLIGRQEEDLPVDDDITKLAKRVLSGTPLREVCTKAAEDSQAYADPYARWKSDNLDEIDEAGGEAKHAYQLYLQGRLDRLAHTLELEVMDEMSALLEDAEALSDEEDEDGDSDPDEEDEDGEEDEDDSEPEEEGESVEERGRDIIFPVRRRTAI